MYRRGRNINGTNNNRATGKRAIRGVLNKALRYDFWNTLNTTEYVSNFPINWRIKWRLYYQEQWKDTGL